jgi:uncharacterized damage-inducible protein DinB
MLTRSPYACRYLFAALEAAPDLFERLLAGLSPEEADRRPDPDRFTIREVMAHLADWEPVFLERMRRICREHEPVMEGYDEGQWAIDHDYAHADVAEQLRLFRERRVEMVGFLRARTPADWAREGERPEIGRVTLEALVLLVPLHDTYHVRQVVAWRQQKA